MGLDDDPVITTKVSALSLSLPWPYVYQRWMRHICSGGLGDTAGLVSSLTQWAD
jgi:hypothetical protein